MKYLMIFLGLLPLLSSAQTVHIEDERIAYRERITVNGVSREELRQRAAAALREVAGVEELQEEKNLVKGKARLRLTSTHSLRNRLRYEISIETGNNGYEYRIDSVYWETDARGKPLVVDPSTKLVSDMEVTGPTAARTEKQLNEIDMRLQKLIVLLRQAMQGTR